MPMEIVAFAKRFENGSWRAWEHECTDQEVEAVLDSAQAKAQNRLHFGPPTYLDCLEGARYVLDVAFGTAGSPRDGDMRVQGVSVDGVLFGISYELSQHFPLLKRVA